MSYHAPKLEGQLWDDSASSIPHAQTAGIGAKQPAEAESRVVGSSTLLKHAEQVRLQTALDVAELSALREEGRRDDDRKNA